MELSKEVKTEIKKFEESQVLILRNGAKIYLEQQEINNIWQILQNLKESKFIRIGNDIINTADLVGIFTYETADYIGNKKYNKINI